MSRVGDLLNTSAQAHRNALQARRTKRSAQATQLLAAARDARLTAHEIDPDHEDPAWADEERLTPGDQSTHDAMLVFYAQQLARAGVS